MGGFLPIGLPFSGEEAPPPPEGGGGGRKRRSKEGVHSAFRSPPQILRLVLGGWSRVLCSVLPRAAAVLLVQGWKIVFIPDSGFEGDDELVHMGLLLVDGVHVLQGLKISRAVELEAHVED